MELLAYFLALFGFFVLVKGAKPALDWIGRHTAKDPAKGIGFIAVVLSLFFYVWVMFGYLKSF